MDGLATRWATPEENRGTVKPLLVWVPGVLAAIWFALCCASVVEFGRIGFLMLARPSLVLGFVLFAASIIAFAVIPKPRVRKDGFALALSLAGSAFTMISFAVASKLAG